MSTISNKKIHNNICFIGVLDLYGQILRVNRSKDKIITAYNNKLDIIYLPLQNKVDEDLIPIEILENVKLRYISNFNEVYNVKNVRV